jgi:hypothetical protein
LSLTRIQVCSVQLGHRCENPVIRKAHVSVVVILVVTVVSDVVSYHHDAPRMRRCLSVYRSIDEGIFLNDLLVTSLRCSARFVVAKNASR